MGGGEEDVQGDLLGPEWWQFLRSEARGWRQILKDLRGPPPLNIYTPSVRAGSPDPEMSTLLKAKVLVSVRIFNDLGGSIFP